MNRVSALARIEFEDAKVELERASRQAQQIGEDLDDAETRDDEWEEYVLVWLPHFYFCPLLCLLHSISLPSDDLTADGMDVDNKAMDGDRPAPKDLNDLSEYNLDTYDEEENTISACQLLHLCDYTHDQALPSASGPFSNIKGLTYHRDNDEDPYITLKEVRFSATSFSIFVLSVGTQG